ncbi:MAG: LytTR family DNA-binding domain-containing protein [Ruminococcus flavefaciens]|nr:LytTR family DNA-binding domain-containing protein [Ruminococcus flavefaciens]MCM1363345.1 LytTR family DNA-binding domain-containing protein [Clostridiales bacterium]
MIRIAIVDDEERICVQVETILLAIAKEQGVQIDTEVYYDGRKLCQNLSDGEFFDLIFLDIEMNGFSGMEVSDSIRNTMKNESTQIAYISGNKEYAIEIFEFDPLYFLHKPLTHEKIEKVFLKLMNRLHLKAEAFSYKASYETVKVPIKDIIYFESDDHKVIIHYYVQNTYKKDYFYGLLDHIEEQMKSYQFLRIHKTYLVNPIHIKRYSYEKIQMSTEFILPIAQSKRKEVRAAQFKLEGN